MISEDESSSAQNQTAENIQDRSLLDIDIKQTDWHKTKLTW